MDLLSKISKHNNALGLSIHFVSQNEYEIAYCLISIEKGQLTIAEKNSIASLEEIPQEIKNLALYINISGKVVLEKVDELSEEDLIIEKAFPNSEVNNFYYQGYSNLNISISSLIRKEKIDELINDLKDKEFMPISVSIGLAVLDNAFEKISELNEINYTVLGKEIYLKDNNIDSYQKNNFDSQMFYIDNNSLSEQEYLAFAAALNILNAREESISISNVLDKEKEDYKHKLLFDKLKIGLPLFFLILLLVNFFLFTNVLDKNNTLSQKDLLNKTTLNQLESLKTEVAKKQAFLKESNWLSQSKVSYYSDQIGLLLPKKISLNQLDIFPAKFIKKNKTKDYEFQTDIILVDGVSNSLEELNNWKLKLQKQQWIKDIELLSYNQEASSKNISFSLKINLN